MRNSLLATLAVLTMIFAFSTVAPAQEMTTDVVFIRGGFVSQTTSFDSKMSGENIGDWTQKGGAGMAEYNMNLNPLWIGFGLEYQYVSDTDADFKVKSHFILPMITAKFVTPAGFYLGAGLSGKYLLSSKGDSKNDPSVKLSFDKKIDLWANGVVGFFTPISEGVYFDVMARFGFNLTNQQFKSGTYTSSTGNRNLSDVWKPKSAYDVAIYVGVGFRAAASGI